MVHDAGDPPGRGHHAHPARRAAEGPGGGEFVSTEADLLHADVEAYRTWLRMGGEGPGPPDEKREIQFWI